MCNAYTLNKLLLAKQTDVIVNDIDYIVILYYSLGTCTYSYRTYSIGTWKKTNQV